MAGPIEQTSPDRKRTVRFMLYWVAGSMLCLLALAFITGEIVAHRAEPILKETIVETLSTRFDCGVQLDHLHVVLFPLVRVSGAGLRLYSRGQQSQYPLIAIDEFGFSAPWRELLEIPTHIERVHVSGLVIHLPPKAERVSLPHEKTGAHIKIFVREIDSDNATLIIENGKPGKVPLKFEISGLRLTSAAAGQPMTFQATLVNPKPVGNIATSGYFGPFQEESPGDTAVGGQYSFRNADLGTLKGIAGTLSSRGNYAGTPDNIVVDGETATPDFQLDIADHPVPLNTTFHAIVDGTNGDTHLQPVDAWLLHSHIVARGDVVHDSSRPGHHIQLDVLVGPALIQDILSLGAKTEQPLLIGGMRMRTSLNLAPGSERVLDRLQMQGSFEVLDAHFTDRRFQSKVDQLSLRGEGEAKQANQEKQAEKSGEDTAEEANVASSISGDFSFGEGKISLHNLAFQAPGAAIVLNGVYTLNGGQLQFDGKAHLQARLAQMVTGWRSLLLKPLDPVFSRGDEGTVIPIAVTGTRRRPHIGLDLHH